MPGLLEEVEVLNLTHYIVGPYCTKLLSGLGAAVVKIERLASGDRVRWLGTFESGNGEIPLGPLYPDPNRERELMRRRIGLGSFYLTMAKQSLALDLKSTEVRKVVLELAT